MDTADLSTAVSLAAAVVALGSFVAITRSPTGRTTAQWPLAVPLAVFSTWSLYAVATEGPRGLWEAHTGTAWETQIWMDLLVMASLVLLLAQPRLRALGAPRTAWAAFVLATGSIGALSLVLWLHRAEASTASDVRAAPSV